MPQNLQRGQRPPQPPTTNGPVNAVQCPHCGRPNDLRELDSQNLLDTGSEIVCSPLEGQRDTGHCGRVFVVVAIQIVKAVVVRPSSRPARHAQASAQPAQAVSPGFLQRLLRGK
jgi:hypothetical protein